MAFIAPGWPAFWSINEHLLPVRFPVAEPLEFRSAPSAGYRLVHSRRRLVHREQDLPLADEPCLLIFESGQRLTDVLA